jgi:hypothetical protein
VDAKIRDILDTLPDKPPRSRLTPYRELISELRRRGRTYRDIAHIISERCQIQITASGVHHFVRTRSRVKGKSTKRIATDAMKTAATAIGAGVLDSAQKPSADDEVQRRIVALKARKPVTKAAPDEFQFDPTQPLRLKKPGKPVPGR